MRLASSPTCSSADNCCVEGRGRNVSTTPGRSDRNRWMYCGTGPTWIGDLRVADPQPSAAAAGRVGGQPLQACDQMRLSASRSCIGSLEEEGQSRDQVEGAAGVRGIDNWGWVIDKGDRRVRKNAGNDLGAVGQGDRLAVAMRQLAAAP